MADAPLRNDADPRWREMHEAAEADQATLSRALALAFAALATRAILLRIRGAMRFRDLEAALQAVPVAQLWTLRPAIEDALRAAALAGMRIGTEAEIVARLGTSQGLPVAELAYWARTRSGALVAGISDQTRRALRDTIAQALEQGLSPFRASKLVEEVVGLNRVQARALRTRAEELVERGVPSARRDAILDRYAARLRRQRALVIARHELMQAANEGRREQWERNVRDGVILPDRWEREWVAIVPSDGRTCRFCQGMDGERAPINGNYPNGSSGPPGHTLCRCTEVLVRGEGA
jgi:hypothetical protein